MGYSLVLYTVIGGLKAVVNTDIFQALLLLFVLVFTLAFALLKNPNLVSNVISTSDWTNMYAYGKSKFVSWLILPLFFMFIEQDMAQRCFSGKSPKIVSFACIFAALILVFSAIVPVSFGMFAKSISDSSAIPKSVFLTSVIATTNPIISALVACAVLAAIISTADSILLAISSNICQDFIDTSSKSNNDLWAKVITAFIGIMSLIGAYYLNNIISVLLLSYDISVCCLLAPILASAFFPKTSFPTSSAWASMILGIIGFALFRTIDPVIPKELASVLLSLIGFIGFYFFDKTKKPQTISK